MDHKFTVVIVQRCLPHYREKFFKLLRKNLSGLNVSLKLIVGGPGKGSAKVTAINKPEWIKYIKNKNIRLKSISLCWQPCWKDLQGADLVVVEQASKLLINYFLFLKKKLRYMKVCLWGHGKNFNLYKANRLSEILKKYISRNAHWWFAYNSTSAEIVRSIGYPANRITAVQNTLDISLLLDTSSKITSQQLQAIKKYHNIESDNVCLFVGSMYREKRLDFLIDACVSLKKLMPDFEMIFIGAGPEKYKVVSAADQYPWLHYVGPKHGQEKVPFFMLSKLLLMPGLVGLAIVDAFALQTPLVTTDIICHSPEINYLTPGYNGIILPANTSSKSYALNIARLLINNNRIDELMTGCRASANKYELNTMVKRFSEGIKKALKASSIGY